LLSGERAQFICVVQGVRVSRPAGEVFHPEERPLVTVARNVSTIYVAVLVDSVLGLVMLPFNVTHLGTAAYGLWVLTASVTVHFSLLNLGYGGALVKFVARYRAHRNAQALNEIASTVFFVFALAGCVAYGVGALIAFNLDTLFRLTPEEAETGKRVLLIISVYVALNFPFSVFGGVVTGFQRQHVNGVVAIVSSVLVAAVNVAVLLAGFGLVSLVLATTVVRVLIYFVYAANAYRCFPSLRLSPALFRWNRLKEVTGFSMYLSVIDWSYKLNYQVDQIVVGAFLGVAPVAVWSVADRIIAATQNLTNQLNGVLFPVVVDCDAAERKERLHQILLEGTRLSLATVLPVATALVVLADPLVRAWVGTAKPELLDSVPVLQILAVVVAIRVGNGTAATVLKGAGQHRMLAGVNLATAMANIALSILLVRVWGLTGVAVGTLVPIAFAAFVIVQPAACRRVGLPLRTALMRSVVPALWPAVVTGAALTLTRGLSSVTLPAVLAQSVFGGVLYFALFFLAIGSRDRALYATKVHELLDRRLAAATS
jgi:O-antigen/teichoic acid export membrane protein